MKIDKYFQHGGYNNLRYREVRSKVNRFLNKDMENQKCSECGKEYNNPLSDMCDTCFEEA